MINLLTTTVHQQEADEQPSDRIGHIQGGQMGQKPWYVTRKHLSPLQRLNVLFSGFLLALEALEEWHDETTLPHLLEIKNVLLKYRGEGGGLRNT